MKKTYIKPYVKIKKVKVNTVLAGSDEPTVYWENEAEENSEGLSKAITWGCNWEDWE